MQIPAHLSGLSQFARAVWGNPRALLRRLSPSPQAVEYIDIGKYISAFRILSAGTVKCRKILVRAEYRFALRKLQTARYHRGAYVTGQHGIGKTYFLIYALVHFLGQKQPVALHLGGQPFYILFKHGTAALYPLTTPNPLYKCRFVWALSDSNANVQIPPVAFAGDTRRVRLIQATAPEASRWKEWSKQIGARGYIMDIWTDEEIVNLALLLGLDTERMSTLAKKWGNIPQTLLQQISRADYHIEARYRRDANTAVVECSDILMGGMGLDLALPSPFYFIRPTKTDTGSVCRELPDMSVPTPTLCRFLAEALPTQEDDTKLEFYNELSDYAQTRQVVNCIYQNWFHSFFSAGRVIDCHWVERGSSDDTLRLPTTLRGSQIIIPSANDAPKGLTPPCYWLASTNFPGIDSALVLEEDIFVFQVTISNKRRSPTEGLHKLREYLPPHLKQVPWRVVFISAEEGIGNVATHWSEELYSEMCLPVAWSVVDPAQDGITYTVYPDEAASVPGESDERMMEVEAI